MISFFSGLVSILLSVNATSEYPQERKSLKKILKKRTNWFRESLRIYSTNTPWFLIVWLFAVLLSYSWWRSSHPITTRINSSSVDSHGLHTHTSFCEISCRILSCTFSCSVWWQILIYLLCSWCPVSLFFKNYKFTGFMMFGLFHFSLNFA